MSTTEPKQEHEHPIEFNSKGFTCRGILYTPKVKTLEKKSGAPIVVMAHGFSGTIEMGLRPYAEKFAESGMYVLLFDYRHFGISDCEPRQFISIERQHEDYFAAIEYARSLEGIDPSRVALFGTSFSGGHVIQVASMDHNIKAVISQCPMVDGIPALAKFISYAGIWMTLKLVMAGTYDLLRSVIGLKPYYVPVVGKPGELSFMSSSDAEQGLMKIASPDYQNEVCGRVGLSIGLYRPGLKIKSIRCPILFLICENDSVAPAKATIKTSRLAGDAVVKKYPIGHFDIYVDRDFERAAKEMVEFLTKSLN